MTNNFAIWSLVSTDTSTPCTPKKMNVLARAELQVLLQQCCVWLSGYSCALVLACLHVCLDVLLATRADVSFFSRDFVTV